MSSRLRDKLVVRFASGALPLAAALAVAPTVLAAQDQSPRAAAATSAKTPAILADSQPVLNELSRLQLDGLLDYAYRKYKVPLEQQRILRYLSSLRQLDGEKTAPLSLAQRQELLKNIVAGTPQIIQRTDDPARLMELAAKLVISGVTQPLNTLEYWGESPRLQAELRPVAESVSAIYERAAVLAGQSADKTANLLKSVDDPRMKVYEDLLQLAAMARYNKAFNDYALALSIDPADPRRAQTAQAAIAALAEFDNPDMGVQNPVRIRIGKLHLAAGRRDEARKRFEQVLADTAAAWALKYEARYFMVVADVLARDLPAAQKGLADLLQWQQANPPDPAGLSPEQHGDLRKGVDAAARMLEFRIHSLDFELSRDPRANERAVAVLLDLVRTRPDLHQVTFDQLMARLPQDPDVTQLDPLLLRAMIGKGEEQLLKPADEPADAKALKQAIAAVRELASRKNIPVDDLDVAFYLLGFFHERAGRHVNAIDAYLDYIGRFPASAQRCNKALDSAMSIVAALRSDPATKDEPGTVRAYERFLAVATAPPMERREFAFEYGYRLFQQDRPADAIAMFRKIPPDDKRILHARFLEMLAQRQVLDNAGASLPSAARAAAAHRIGQLADSLAEQIDRELASADASTAASLRSMRIRTALLAADIARREEKNPARTLQLLKDFEQQVEGLPGANDLLGEALFMRASSLMSLDRNSEATDQLVGMLQRAEGNQGLDIIFTLLQKLNEDLDAARAAGDAGRIRELARNRAALSGFLVKWAAENPDPNVRRHTYRYRVFDADTKHLRADLEEDPAARKAGLEESLRLYESLLSSDNIAEYQASLAGTDTDPRYSDPAVLLGIALVRFDLGDYRHAQPLLAQLLGDRKLGTARSARQVGPGLWKDVDNDRYWEAMYKLLRCNAEICRTPPADLADPAQLLEDTRTKLKQLYIQWGAPGGTAWRAGFDALRHELLPDWSPPDLAAPPTQP